MSRRIWIFTPLVLLLASQSAQADWFTDFWTSSQQDYYRNMSWPEPFPHVERAAVMTPFAIMEANGWHKQNLVASYHFSDDNSQLTDAGLRKARWILTQAPPSRRTLFVERGDDRKTTELRLQAVHRAADRILPQGMLADIQESHLREVGRPAEEIDRHLVKYRENVPAPKLSDSKPLDE